MAVLTRVGRNGVPQHTHRIVGHPTVWHPASRFHRNDILAHEREGASQPEWVGARRDDRAYAAAIAFAERSGRVLGYTTRQAALVAAGFTADAAAALANAGNLTATRAALADAATAPVAVAVRQTVLALSARKFGVELEVIVDRYALEDALRARGLVVRGESRTHETRDHWKIVTDGSLGHGGFELVSPPMSGPDGFNQLRLACEALRAAGARVDRSCGLHVHVEIRDFTGAQAASVARAYTDAAATITAFMSPSRQHNSYCGQWDAQNLRRVATAHAVSDVAYNQGGRYKVVNFEAFPRQGTVEFRQHQGTTDYGKAGAWVRFALGMCDAAARDGLASFTGDAGQLAASLGLDERDQRYFARRTEYFANGRRVA